MVWEGVWVFFISALAAHVLSLPASACYFVHNALWKEHCFTFRFINISISILPVWCLQTGEDESRMICRCHFTLNTDTFFSPFWLLTWASKLSVFHWGCAPSYRVDWNAAFSSNKSVFLIHFCPKITVLPYCIYYWCSQKIINSHYYKLSYERNRVLWSYRSLRNYAK